MTAAVQLDLNYKETNMRTAGIIAEYNPFHCGHLYHIEETRRRTGADYIIAVMSGDFVQRGAPSILDKYTRAKLALRGGADLVLELPVTAALSSAEGFAVGGVCLLDALAVVTDLSFGAEIRDELEGETLISLSECLAREPKIMRLSLDKGLRSGMSFPAAYAQALQAYLSTDTALWGDGSDFTEQAFRLIQTPNNILALEYLKVLQRKKITISPCLIPRAGAAYHDQSLQTELASASAIRSFLLDPGSALAERGSDLAKQVPDFVLCCLQAAAKEGVLTEEDDFSVVLHYALLTQGGELERYGSANGDFSRRIGGLLEDYEGWTQFVSLLKTKNQTYTAISRRLAQILLGMTREELQLAAGLDHAPYARILGFRKTAAPLIRRIRQESRVPVLMQLARDMRSLSDTQRRLLELDLRASELYNMITFSKTGQKTQNDFRRSLVIL